MIRQTTTVRKQGRLEILSLELPVGKTVEIIILTEPSKSKKFRSRGVTGRRLLPFSGCIESGELKTMSQVIENDCSQVDLNEW